VDGSVNLSTVRLLAPYLTPENCDEVLAEAAGKSKRDVEVLVARLAPRPDESPSIRRLPPVPHARASAPTDAAGAGIQSQSGIPGCAGARGCSEIDRCSVTEGRASSCGAGQPSEVRVVSGSLSESTACPTKPDLGPTVDGPCAMAANRPLVTPLSPERYRVQFTVGRETHERLGRAQDLLRREIPDGDPGEIFDRALGLLLEDVARKKLAATSNPRPARTPAAGSRHIPARLKRAVWLRDGGRCAFVARSGRRCQETRVPGVPPYRPLCDWGRDHPGQPVAPMPRPQRPRGRAPVRVVRAGRESRGPGRRQAARLINSPRGE